MEKKKIVFLYTELATYFLACVEKLFVHPQIEVHIVCWEVNKEAPFHFTFSENLKIYYRNTLPEAEQLQSLVDKISPSIIYVSGWKDKNYLKVCKQYNKKIPVIVGFDNQWTGSIKQRVASVLSPFTLLKHFSYCWVPGDVQIKLAENLGFSKTKILTGFYSCDYDYFHSQYLANEEAKRARFPHRFIYVGRYVQHKGISDLWKAFIELCEESPHDWELWCLGTGDVAPVVHPKIKHFGFVQPSDMARFIADTGVFVLPSHFEPWGVVVHEFATAGFPIICSEDVGASSSFLVNGKNGFSFSTGNIGQLKETMKRIINSSDQELLLMADKSAETGKLTTPKKWANTLLSLLPKNSNTVKK
jgi:glycosyltransferase involved in cell wall biosynthesis